MNMNPRNKKTHLQDTADWSSLVGTSSAPQLWILSSSSQSRDEAENESSAAEKPRPALFPFRMYDLLEDAERLGFEDIVCWMPSGKAFKIHSRYAFEQRCMPSYFPNMNSYKSFRRQLNLYGIYQDKMNEKNCPDNTYSHRLFVRGHRYLCEFMERPKQKASSSQEAVKGICSKIDNVQRTSAFTPFDGIVSSDDSIATSFPCHAETNRASNSPNPLQDSPTDSKPNSLPTRNTSLTPPTTVDAARQIYQSFVNQGWKWLPEGTTPMDIIEEIIDIFLVGETMGRSRKGSYVPSTS